MCVGLPKRRSGASSPEGAVSAIPGETTIASGPTGEAGRVPGNSTTASGYRRPWTEDAWPVMLGCVLSWLLDAVILAAVWYGHKVDKSQEDLYVIHTYYAIVV
jgi:hypothetical protein